MIKVNITDKKITIKGHAGYDEYGRDIVCASASSIAITTINAILSFDSEAINYEQKKDELIINVLKNDKYTKTLLNIHFLHIFCKKAMKIYLLSIVSGFMSCLIRRYSAISAYFVPGFP